MQVNDRENVSYDQYIINVISVISRSTHLLALPPCKKLDPVVSNSRQEVFDRSVG